MSQQTIDERKLSELTPARRNRYYYGKLMDVLHFSMEQQYVLAKEWLYNRAVLGAGVVCGLVVEPLTTEAGKGVVVRAGLAIDGWGREIVVPEDVALVPLTLTDPCGVPLASANGGTNTGLAAFPGESTHGTSPRGAALPKELRVEICYAECTTDFAPSFVSDDCGCDGGCEAGTIVETYCLCVREGHGEEVGEPCLDSVMRGIKSGHLHRVLCELTASCAPDPADPCLTLANLTVDVDTDENDVNLVVDSCSVRPIAPSNRVLMQLIRCLAECCAGHDEPPPPPPPPPPVKLLQVTAVRVFRLDDAAPEAPGLTLLGELEPPSSAVSVSLDDRPEVVEVEFDSAVTYDQATVVLGKSFVVQPASKLDKLIFTAPGNVVRLHRRRGFSTAGKTKFILRGDPVSAGDPAIAGVNGKRLDGEPPGTGGAGWHSGDGTEGGDFTFVLQVRQ